MFLFFLLNSYFSTLKTNKTPLFKILRRSLAFFSGTLAFFVFAGTSGAETIDLIALSSTDSKSEIPENVGIIALNNADLAPPAGFENGYQTARENGRQIRYYIMDGDSSAWSALVGNGIEYWSDTTGAGLGVELCAGPRSRGIKQRFSMEATNDFCGGYALVWNHYGRVPQTGTIDYSYTVRITAGDPSSETAQTIGTPLTIESSRVTAGGTAKECFFFGIDETHLPAIEENGLWVSFSPNSSSTFSAVVGNIKIVKICMAVDKNRDGSVSFGGDDLTSEAEPYRFWINNDCDDADMGEGDVSSIDRTGSDDPDSEDEVPNSIRDLEDFSRLQIRLFGDSNAIDWLCGELAESRIKALIACQASGNDVPAIRVVKHLDSTGSLRYLYESESASQVLGEPKESFLSVLISTLEAWIDAILGWLWETEEDLDLSDMGFLGVSAEDAQAEFSHLIGGGPGNFLFEGTQKGVGQFKLIFSKSETHLQETSSVWLELLDIREMFEQVQIVETEGDENTEYSWESAQFGTFRKAWDEASDKQIVFVHGWNMEKEGAACYAETSFKRLWWQNYRGRFSSVYWPTETGGTTYCPSEFIAWKSGKAMKDYLNSLKDENSSRVVSVMAHSMGNIVVGSALKAGAIINNYILMNAAIPAECYDDSENLRHLESETKTLTDRDLILANIATNGNADADYEAWTLPSLGDDPNPEVSALAYRGALCDVSCKFFNFYLPEDFATEEAWEFNNSTQKPWDGVGWSDVYSYEPGNIPTCSGTLFVSRNVTDRYEAMAFVDSSKTQVVGTEAGVEKFENTNMGDANRENGYNFGNIHSAQFVLEFQKTWNFWVELAEIFKNE